MAFEGQKCSIQQSGGNITDPMVHFLRDVGAVKFSTDPERIATGRNSLYQALNVTGLAGARVALMLGMDGKPAEDGKDHWFGEHVLNGKRKPTPESCFPMYREAWKDGAPAIKASGLRVINCTPGSAVDAFERMDLDQALRL